MTTKIFLDLVSNNNTITYVYCKVCTAYPITDDRPGRRGGVSSLLVVLLLARCRLAGGTVLPVMALPVVRTGDCSTALRSLVLPNQPRSLTAVRPPAPRRVFL